MTEFETRAVALRHLLCPSCVRARGAHHDPKYRRLSEHAIGFCFDCGAPARDVPLELYACVVVLEERSAC